MSWIDIFLADGDPNKVYGADAKAALSRMPTLRNLPWLWSAYCKARLPLREQVLFVLLDVLRFAAYRKGFKDGKRFRWNVTGGKS